jgi:hypothetical protein
MRLTFRVLDNAGDLALHDGDGRVSGTEIDTDHGALDLAIRLSRLIASELRSQRRSGEGSRSSDEGGSSRKLIRWSVHGGMKRLLCSSMTYSSRQARSQHLDYRNMGTEYRKER